MKNRIALLITGIAFSWTPLAADYDLSDTGSEEITQETQGQYTPSAKGDWVMRSKHDTHEYSGHIDYSHEEVSFNAVVFYNKCFKEGLSLELEYGHTHLHWNENPFFERQNYDTLSASLTYFTHRLSGWRWLAQGTVNFDADKWQFSDYTTYNIMLWGRYDYRCDLGLHFGFYAETGMKLDRIWPILGVDWTINERWLLNAIYPLNVSIVYTWNEMWSFALAGRVFNERQRAGKAGGFYEAVWRYQNTGAEFAINNTWCSWLKSNVHVGYTFGGKLKIANRNAHHSHRFKFGSAPYFGFEVTSNF